MYALRHIQGHDNYFVYAPVISKVMTTRSCMHYVISKVITTRSCYALVIYKVITIHAFLMRRIPLWYSSVRLKALHRKHYNSERPNLIMHCLAYSIPLSCVISGSRFNIHEQVNPGTFCACVRVCIPGNRHNLFYLSNFQLVTQIRRDAALEVTW